MFHFKKGDIMDKKVARNSIDLIRNHFYGETLTKDQFKQILQDALNEKIPDVALTYFLARQECKPYTNKEIADLTIAMVELGKTVEFGLNTVDKHSIGGVPGNKVSLLIVPIIAQTGLKIPKTSSRSITTIGTADKMEVLAPVELSLDEVVEVVNKTNGCIVWGGTLDISPADDLFIRKVERVLKIDPIPQMIASILSKKLAMGVKYLVLDIPEGRGTKVETMEKAVELADMFTNIGAILGINVYAAITYGEQPVGHAVGVALEAKEALMALEGKHVSTSLVEKATGLAGMLLEMTGRAEVNKGKEIAKEILTSGKALKKMKEIIEAQGGDPNVKSEDIEVGRYVAEFKASADGFVVSVSNPAIMEVVRAAGAPEDKGAGVIIHKKGGRHVKKGETLMTIYSNNEARLDEALSLARTLQPIVIEGMIRKTVTPLKLLREPQTEMD
ncbi:MAG: AMP phosphorylase [Candidatus Njordarchaeia archaeon]